MPQVLVTTAILLVFSGPLGEEPGWRGFALPRLLDQHGALIVSLIIGVVWAAWHLPLALLGELSLHGSVHVIPAAIVFTWLWQNTNSVLLAILMHAAHQNGARFLGRLFADGDAVQWNWIVTAIWFAAAAAIIATYGARSFARPAPAKVIAA